jgi:hypothetical protein
MLNKVVTLEQVLSWKPCYDREKILWLSRGKTELTVGEIIDLKFVPVENKFWLLLREEIIPARILHEFAIWCAEIALTKDNVTDERSWNALKVKRLWLDGKATDKELDAASDAAKYAAINAARYATWAVAWAAAWTAAMDAARAAAMYASKYAARAITRATATDAQLAKLKEMLERASL